MWLQVAEGDKDRGCENSWAILVLTFPISVILSLNIPLQFSPLPYPHSFVCRLFFSFNFCVPAFCILNWWVLCFHITSTFEYQPRPRDSPIWCFMKRERGTSMYLADQKKKHQCIFCIWAWVLASNPMLSLSFFFHYSTFIVLTWINIVMCSKLCTTYLIWLWLWLSSPDW